MPKSSENRFGEFFALPNPGLRSYFDIVRRGQPDEYRTPFAQKKSVQKILKEWKPHVDKLTDKWPSLVEFENDLAKKVGPMSIMKPLADRMVDIDSYYDSILLESAPISEKAVAAVLAEWSKVRGLRIRSQARTLDLMKKSTNSGSPYFTKRRRVIEDTVPCVINSASYGRGGHDYFPAMIQYPHDMSWEEAVMYGVDNATSEWHGCAVLGWRGQEGGPSADDVKQRVVWMFPFAVNINELMCYQPLIEVAQKQNLVPAWVSMDAVDQEITALFDTKSPDDLVICTDFSKFDQHFNSQMQDAAKRILTGILDHSDSSRAWLNTVFPVKYNIPLAYDYGFIRFGHHGMGSGSGGTNADETLAHRALQFEAAISKNQRLNPHSQCLGDDGILSYPGITVDDVVQSYTAHGLEMNTSKQYASKQDCTYLRRWHHRDYRVDGVCAGVYSTYRALGRLCEQERYYDPEIWGPKMVALRQLSIIENVKYHPLRDEFAEFCMARDKYRLGIDIPGFLDNIASIAHEATEVMPDFLGYTKAQQKDAETGIDTWWIVQYLKSHK